MSNQKTKYKTAQQEKETYKENSFINTNIIDPYDTGALSNLAFAVKDNIDLANVVTGYGSPSWKKTHTPAVSNAICVDQLLSDGATCLGKTVSDELAYSLIGINPFYGTPLNPNAPNRVPGGSSSGSASAVAAGIVDFALGTDTAGSIRVPASNCGVWGYRPSQGVISTSGVAALGPSFDTVGVIAKNSEILQQVINGLIGNTTVIGNAAPKIIQVTDVFNLCNTDVVNAANNFIATLSSHYDVESFSLSEITGIQIDCNWLFEHSAYLLSAEIWNTFGRWVTEAEPELSPAVKYNLENYAKPVERANIQKWIQARYLFATKLNDFLSKGNVLCFPTTPTIAPKLDEITEEFLKEGDYYPKSMGINAISGLSGTPQITIPLTQSDVPIGLSFLAGYKQDIMLAELGNTLGEVKLSN